MSRQIVPDVPKKAFLMSRHFVPKVPNPVPDIPNPESISGGLRKNQIGTVAWFRRKQG
jgi:hypothetical protein